MPKPVVALRKPPSTPPPEAVAAFVDGGGERSNVRATKRLDVQTSERSSKAVVTRADGRELRRMTIYIPADLAKRLRLHCTETDREISAVVGEAVGGYLGV